MLLRPRCSIQSYFVETFHGSATQPEASAGSLRTQLLEICAKRAAETGEDAVRVAEAHAARLRAEADRELASANARTDAAERLARELRQQIDGVATSVRMIRGAKEPAAVLVELVDAMAPLSRSAVLLLRSYKSIVGFRAAGAGDWPGTDELRRLSVAIAAAPPVAHAVESGDTVVTTATPHNLSRRLASAFPFKDQAPIRVIPVMLRSTVLAVLLVEADDSQTSAIEVLVLTTEAWVEALGSRSNESTVEHE